MPIRHGSLRLLSALGSQAQVDGPRRQAAPGPVRARLCQAQQDRRGRCRRPDRGLTCSRYPPGSDQNRYQQPILLLHRLPEQHKHTRGARNNLPRGRLPEVGHDNPQRGARGLASMGRSAALADNGLPDALRPFIAEGLAEITALKQRTLDLERQIQNLTQDDELVQRWLAVPGIGLLGASALRATTGELNRFPTGRHLASWLGLTAREHSSGELRRLGRISKRGDTYLRTLLIHGARSALQAAHRAERSGRS